MSSLKGAKALVAKLGMDAHWRGAIVIANALRDAGMEVVYLGHATAEEIASVAVQEDAVLVGLSSLSGSHLVEAPAVLGALRERGVHPLVVVGGAIPEPDVQLLLEAGIAAVYPTGSPVAAILEDLSERLAAAQQHSPGTVPL